LLRSARNDERGTLPNRDGERRRERRADSEKHEALKQRGFTLVEVIVVLVILAILAAIAIPALTGYIDKAEDKEYIAKARNISMAIKTLLSEDYAAGKFANYNYFFEGSTAYDNQTVFFDIYDVSSTSHNDGKWYYEKASALSGEAYDRTSANPNSWGLLTVSTKNLDPTALTADGFYYYFYPNGYHSGDDVIIVMYKAKSSTGSLYDVFDGDYEYLKYDPDCGYTVERYPIP
jgi:prepilin-type N-terminal cleavage/methylation domain-containing protein